MTARHGADEHRREVTATGIDTEHLVAMGETEHLVAMGETEHLVAMGETEHLVAMGETEHLVAMGETEHLVAMGEVAVWAARVERTLAMVVTALISTEAATGVTVTNGMGYSTLSDLGKRLVDQRPENDQPRAMYLNLLPRMKEAMAHRNHLLHGEWNQLDEGPASVTLTRMGGSKERAYSVEQVEQVAYELASVAKRLFLLVLIIDDVLEYDWFPTSTGASDTW